MVKTLVAMSGGVDSSTVAAVLTDAGDDVTGITILLWGGERVGRSCSTTDTAAAEAAARSIGIPHVALDRRAMFDQEVLDPFVSAAREGRTLNPCLSCNMTVKWDALLSFAHMEGFDRVATGHYARTVRSGGGVRVARATDVDKDQSYVLWGTTPAQAAMFTFPLGDMTKADTRALAGQYGLDAADAADSMDLCFDRAQVIGDRLSVRQAPAVTPDGRTVGEVPVELVTIGQRKGLPFTATGERMYVTGITPTRVTLGPSRDLVVDGVDLDGVVLHSPATGPLMGQTSAHGMPASGRLIEDRFVWDAPHRRVSPGQAVVLYDHDGVVVGGGTAR